MKVLDAAELHAGVEETLKGLSQLNVQLEAIEKNIKALIALEDSFKGDGGHSIRSFYEEAHLPLLRFWQDTLAQYETALKQLISSLRGFEPSPQGFIRQSFLEHDVEQGLKQAETITRELTAEGNSIIDSVSDIVALPRLNDSAFVQQVKTAEQHEQETLERLHEFDRQGSYSLEATSQDLHTLHRTIQEISTLFERRELVLSQYRPSQLALKLSILPIPNLERFLSYSLSSVQSNLEEQGLTTNPAATANDSVEGTESNWRGWLSGGLDFIPGISNIKSGIEALTGKDFITGRDIGNLERGVLLAAIFGGPIAKGGVKVFKWGGKQLDKIKHVLNPDKVIETGKAVLAKVKQGFNSLRNTAAGLMKKIADTPLPTPQFAMAGGAKMPQATIGDTINSAKNSVMNMAQKVKDGVGKGAGKSNLKVQFTKEQLATKPSYSPAPDKWTKKGGTVKIVEDGTWVYTNKKGQTVRYPDGYPDFTEYAHPTVKPVEIEIASPTNRPMDYKSANKKAGLNKDSDPPVASLNEAPEGYTWHHHQDGKTMILVDKKVHREFTHAGGVSIVNGN